MAPIKRKKRSESPSSNPGPSKSTTTEQIPSLITSPQQPPHLQPAPAILSNMVQPLTSTRPHLSPEALVPKTPSRLKSPIRRVNRGGITKAQRQLLIDNLELEMTARLRRSRAQYEVQAKALKQRIEFRINRVPKKLWTAKMGDLLAQHSSTSSSSNLPASNARPETASGKLNARSFVEDIKRLSMSSTDSKPTSLTVAKKRTKKPTAPSSSQPTTITIPASSFPPPPSHPPPSFPLSKSSSFTNFATNQTRPLSPIKQSPMKPPQIAIKKPQPPLNPPILDSSDIELANGNNKKLPSRSNSRAAVKNATSKVAKSSKPSSSKTKSSSSRPATAKGTSATTTSKSKAAPLGDTSNPGGFSLPGPVYDETGNNTSRFIKNIGSNGSFKENGGRPVTADGRLLQVSKTGLGERHGNGNGNGGDVVREKVEKLEKAEKGAAVGPGTGTLRRTLRNRK